jgi:CDP-glycerol glycerophosphotransferase
MKVVWQSFEGRYSDNARTIFQRWQEVRDADDHLWLADARHLAGFPADVRTVPIYGPDCVAALERSDVLIATTHTDVEWRKREGSLYVQTWHGTPLKRVHRDVLWAPPGRLDRLQRDIDRWDVLLSPNPASTPRLRSAFCYDGEVLETGYPRNDLLAAPDSEDRRRRVRAQYGIPDDVQALLYTPTWRDDVVFADEAPIALELDPDVLLKQLGPGHCLLVRAHPLVADRLAMLGGDKVIDVSGHPDVAELYLAADLMITDYSSTMFDFAITGKPLIFFVYDLDRFADTTRGFYFALADEAPGPLVRTQDELVTVLHDLPAMCAAHTEAYGAFRRRYCSLEDGHATDRVLAAIFDRVQ